MSGAASARLGGGSSCRDKSSARFGGESSWRDAGSARFGKPSSRNAKFCSRFSIPRARFSKPKANSKGPKAAFSVGKAGFARFCPPQTAVCSKTASVGLKVAFEGGDPGAPNHHSATPLLQPPVAPRLQHSHPPFFRRRCPWPIRYAKPPNRLPPPLLVLLAAHFTVHRPPATRKSVPAFPVATPAPCNRSASPSTT